ncbi:MAG TPA: RidA family protein [Burkholderiales bacterium]|jgi:enamine deaminase RidA (YjgF/YER057c/UK114 family)|nr:RidA family protein [Burkholderiales bacterium]
MMEKKYLNPNALGAAPKFYSHAVSLAGQAKLVYVSGQVSWGPDGRVVGAGDMRAQCEQVFKNLTAVLAAAGAGWGDIVKMNSYMVNLNAENVAAFREMRSGYLKSGQMPASTLVGVTSLVQPELLLEVEVVAALGAAAARPKPKAKKKRR